MTAVLIPTASEDEWLAARRRGVTASERNRILSQLVTGPETGCLLWTGDCYPNGYGRVWIPSRGYVLVHRAVWELFEGEIPEGLELDHVKERGCRYRHCASIAHLEPVTGWVNRLRGDSPPALNAGKTECDAGHPFDLMNTYVASDGHRDCRACKRSYYRSERGRELARERARRYRARKRAGM